MSADPVNTSKPWIRPLPERLVNKIAAGEVIERPSAVLKELVENSLDAGATSIDIRIEKSGLKLISVIDNGCGIDPDQIEIAFSRHATSKIRDFNDLEALTSYGFRGEALPSIGSVSRTRMISRMAENEAGREIIIEGGVVKSVKPTGAPPGTGVEVSDLFYNTPARRKFLKSEVTEARHLTRTATALALSAPGIRFNYMLNGRHLFTEDSAAGDAASRVSRLLLGDNGGSLFEPEYESDMIRISGFLGYPDRVRKNRYGLYVFINNRYIYSQTLLHAIMAGYGELLPPGNYPVGAVFLTVDPKRVDVNVHPTKAEVRLSEERQIHDLLYQSVKRAIRSSESVPGHHLGIGSGVEAERRSVPEALKRVKSVPSAEEIKRSQEVLRKLYEPVVEKEIPEKPPALPDRAAGKAGTAERSDKGDSEIVDRHMPPAYKFLAQLDDLYLIFSSSRELLIIDQHTAHERVLYEQYLKNIESGGAVSQQLLFPITIDLPSDRYAAFEESHAALESVGFVIEPFGTRAVLLTGVPSSLKQKSPEKVFNEILNDVEELKRAGEEIRKAVAQSMACRAAVMAGDRLNEKEAAVLLENLLKAENKHCCPHGRPIILKITLDELNRKFGRQ